MKMTKYKIVEFEDGKFAVQESYFFGLFKSYLSRYIEGNTWSDSARIEFYCKVRSLDEAKKVLELHTKSDPQFQTKIKREIDV